MRLFLTAIASAIFTPGNRRTAHLQAAAARPPPEWVEMICGFAPCMVSYFRGVDNLRLPLVWQGWSSITGLGAVSTPSQRVESRDKEPYCCRHSHGMEPKAGKE